MTFRSEAELYPKLKEFLAGQGYTVKGEVRGCDLVGVRGVEPPVIVELKLRFSLGLVLQGVERLALTDRVYLAVPELGRRRRGVPSPSDGEVRKLCRMLGLGLITVHPSRIPAVEVLIDPLPYRPRKDRNGRERLLREHARRTGDPSPGGVSRRPIVTAYRQEALRCADLLRRDGPTALVQLRRSGHVPNAAKILQRDVYGWFERVRRGVYDLSPAGIQALTTFAAAFEPAPEGEGEPRFETASKRLTRNS